MSSILREVSLSMKWGKFDLSCVILDVLNRVVLEGSVQYN